MSNKRNNLRRVGGAVALALVAGCGDGDKNTNTQQVTNNTGVSVVAAGNTNVTTCNPVFGGDLQNSPVKVKCGADISLAAVAKLEMHLQAKLSQTITDNQGTAVISGGNANVLTCNPEFRGDLRNSPITVECGISPAQVVEMAANWEKQYREQVANLKEQLVFNPNDELLKSALAAALDGDLEKAFQLRKQRFNQREEKAFSKLAAEAYQVAQAAQLTFKPQEGLPYLKKAYGYQPDNLDYAIAYADLLQKQNERKQAQSIYQKLLSALREEVVTDPTKRITLSRILNNLGNLVSDDSQRSKEAEALYNEALSLRRQFAKDNQAVYLPDVAITLNNLGLLVAADSQRRKEAETLYSEALSLHRHLAKDNPEVYLPKVAMTLNNLGNLVSDDKQRRKQAETLYSEALSLRRQLAKDSLAVYLPDVATTLNNLGLLVAADSQRSKEAKALYSEALSLHRQLAKDNPAVYLSGVATTLNNLGILVSDESQRRKEAENIFSEALSLCRQLVKDNPDVYLPKVAMTLNNLGILISDDSQRRKEAENIFREALSLRRQLAKDNPAVYLPDVANTLGAFGRAYLSWNEPDQALPLLQESAQLFAPLAQQAPGVFGGKYDIVLLDIMLLEINMANVANR